MGLGRSDKLTDAGAYSFAFHYDRLDRFVDALGLSGLTMVVQDWGGPLGLRHATQHPARVARLVILNTGLMSGETVTLSPGLVKWREYALRTPDLPIGQTIKRSVVDRDGLSDAVVAAYDAPFPTPESKAGARAFPALIPTTPERARRRGDPGDACGLGLMEEAGARLFQRLGSRLSARRRPRARRAYRAPPSPSSRAPVIFCRRKRARR